MITKVAETALENLEHYYTQVKQGEYSIVTLYSESVGVQVWGIQRVTMDKDLLVEGKIPGLIYRHIVARGIASYADAEFYLACYTSIPKIIEEVRALKKLLKAEKLLNEPYKQLSYTLSQQINEMNQLESAPQRGKLLKQPEVITQQRGISPELLATLVASVFAQLGKSPEQCVDISVVIAPDVTS